MEHEPDEMPALPEGLTAYKQTPIFDETTLPSGLRNRHTLKAGTWGRIVVLEGRLAYLIEGAPELAFELTPQRFGVVPPEVPHHVEARGPVRFYVEMLRRER